MAAAEHNYSHEIENWRQRLVKESKAAKVLTSSDDHARYVLQRVALCVNTRSLRRTLRTVEIGLKAREHTDTNVRTAHRDCYCLEGACICANICIVTRKQSTAASISLFFAQYPQSSGTPL
jgi:hypothetical protein